MLLLLLVGCILKLSSSASIIDSSLIEAAKAGDVRLVKRALEFGNCLDDVDDDDRCV